MSGGHGSTSATSSIDQSMGQRKVAISYVIRDVEEKLNRAGVNKLCLDPTHQLLYTAGRDSIIRSWDLSQSDTGECPHVKSFEYHTDWVNDIVLCMDGKHIISASSDTTMKVWNTNRGLCASTLRLHKDYIRCLAYAKETAMLASADLNIYLWDVKSLTSLTETNRTAYATHVTGQKDSVYSLAINDTGTVLVSGSTEKLLRVWDPRSCEQVMTLKGHTDNVRALLLNRDDSLCLSGSSDGTVRLWSLGQQRCVETYRAHRGEVWALAVNEQFTTFYSGGSDKRVYATKMKGGQDTLLFCEDSPILSLALDTSGSTENLWVATTDTAVNKWSMVSGEDLMMTDAHEPTPVFSKPVYTLPGGSSIKEFCVLDNKQQILTRDSDNRVALWDVLHARKLKDLGCVDLHEEAYHRQEKYYVPNWFSVEIKTGMLTIRLEENECFSAWVLGTHIINAVGLGHLKMNLGALVLHALFEHWPSTHPQQEYKELDISDLSPYRNDFYFHVPKHIPVIIAESEGCETMLVRFLCGDTGGSYETRQLNNLCPVWVKNIVCQKKFPQPLKTVFSLVKYSEETQKSNEGKVDLLSAQEFLSIKKVQEYVCPKLFGNKEGKCENTEEEVDRVEILCMNQVLEPDLDLRTVKYFIWKNSGDMKLYYREKPSLSAAKEERHEPSFGYGREVTTRLLQERTRAKGTSWISRRTYIVEHPSSFSSKPGSRVEFSIKTYPASKKHQWYFQNRIISSQDANYSGSTEGNLEIKRCMPKHKGEYYCEIIDESGGIVTSETAILSIEGKKMTKEECKLLGEILSKDQISLTVYGIEVKELIEASCEVTYEEMQFVLGDNPMTRILSKNLKQELAAKLEETNLYRKALEDDSKVALSYTKILALGPGQVGKSTFLNRLLGVMKGNICTSSPGTQPQCSTGVAELREACISYNTRTGALESENWQVFDRSSDLESQLEGFISLLSEQALQRLHDDFSQLLHTMKSLIPRDSTKTEHNITSEDKHKVVLVGHAGPEAIISSMKPASFSLPAKNVAGSATVSKSQASKVKSPSNQAKAVTPSSQPNTRQSDIRPQRNSQKADYPVPKLSNIDTVVMDFEKISNKCQNSANKAKFNMLFNIADIGGQPAFLEMLPSLTIGPALYLVFMKLLEGLTTRYPVVFKCKDGRGSKLCKNYTYTSEEVIFSALSSIACFGNSDEEVEQYVASSGSKKQANSLALLVGTFRDKIETDSQLDSIDHQIKQLLKETYFFNAGLLYSTTFLKVDNYSAPETEILEHRTLLKNILEKKFQKYEIPARWLTLSICLKLLSRIEQRYDVSFDDCVDLGSRIGMSEDMVRVALQFLHKYIGLVMYFPRNDHLKNVVICDPQVIFSSISELIFNIYDPKNMYITEAEHDHFVRTGCFSPQDIKDSESFSTTHLSLDTLVHLLVHLNIIAEVPANLGYNANGQTEDTVNPQKKYYFLPAVLQTAESSLLAREAREMHFPEPLCIRFQTGYIPLGFVCALSANLIAEGDFELIPFQQGNDQITYKNKIKFRFLGKFDIILISSHKYCEFQVIRKSGNVEYRDNACCPQIKTIICEAADKVVQSLKHGSLYKPLNNQTYELAFRCPMHHEAEIRHEPMAKFVYNNVIGSTIDGNIPKEIQCVDSSCLISSALTPQMQMWFGEAISPPKITEFSADNNVIKVKVNGTKPLQYKWLKDGEVISDDDSYQGSATPELTIVGTGPQVAKFKCSVKNAFGEILSQEILWGAFPKELKQNNLTDEEISELICNRIHSLNDLKGLTHQDVEKMRLSIGGRSRVKQLISSLSPAMDTSQAPLTQNIFSRVSGLRTITIEELKFCTRLTDFQLDSQIHVKDMRNLSAYFENVESYLTHLDLTPSQETDIKDMASKRSTQIAMTEALKLWSKPNPLNATYRKLVMILLELGEGKVASDVCVYISKK